MKRFGGLVAVGAAAALGVGVAASGASAYSISGGSYVGTATADHSWTVDAGIMFSCPVAVIAYSGTATGADTMSFTPYYGAAADCDGPGFPATVTQSGSWSLEVVAGPDMNGYYDGELVVPSGSSTVVDLSIGGCPATFAGLQTFRHGVNGAVIRMKNVGSGVTLELDLAGFTYTMSTPCYLPGPGVYSTNGVVDIPGITIS